MLKKQKGDVMIITVGGIKGGCGKSLVSSNLCVLRSINKKVLLVDADEQGTISDWTNHRINLGITTNWTTVKLRSAAVRTEVLKLAQNYDDIIIDCGGRDTVSLRAALTISDIFLVPFQPKSFDIWTIEKVSELVAEATALNHKLKCYSFINCAGSRGTDNLDAANILSKAAGIEFLPVMIGLRKAFSNAPAEGLGVIELFKDKKAENELKDLYQIIFKEVFKSVKNTQKRHQNNVKQMMSN